jgi:hypothetical protein
MESYHCVVCQEEITSQEHSYSTKFYNMALCRKHQEIQKIALARQTEEQKTGTKADNYSCIVCNEAITVEENSYSKNLFNMALCRKHQEIQKQAKAKADSEQKTEKVSTEGKIPSKVDRKEPESKVQKNNISEKTQDNLIQWLTEWVNAEPIKVELESKHFFLEGMRLEEFSRKTIGKAKDEIIVANPYLDSCYLATALQEARERRVNVKIVTRRPTKDKENLSKIECHAALRKKGVTIHYINTIHAKIIVIDRRIAILSSMNLYSGSAGGGVLEAGIVSFEEKVVTPQAKYITELLEKTESPDITSYNKYYGRR